MDHSLQIVGQLYPVLRDAEGKVIDGKHRLDSDPNWFSRTLPHVKTEEQRILVAFHANVGRRKIPVKEKAGMINALAEIYLAQGLKVQASSVIKDRDGRNKHITENEISQRLYADLKGLVGKSTIGFLLDPKFKVTHLSDAMKKAAKTRQDRTRAYDLIYDSFSKHICRSFGKGIFERMKREMLEEAKERLRVDSRFIKEIEGSLRKEMETQIGAELEIMKGEWNIEKQSFFNLTNHYEKALRIIDAGGTLSDSGITMSESASLKSNGVLSKTQRRTVSLASRVILGLVPMG